MAGTSNRPVCDPKLIELSERDLEDAKRLLSRIIVAGDVTRKRTKVVDAMRVGPEPIHQDRAFEILARRRRRHRLFGKAMFGEPAWEMLLLLYVSASGARQTTSRLAALAGASKSTAIRWMDYLETQGLIGREASPLDKRVIYVELTAKGKDVLELYLSGEDLE